MQRRLLDPRRCASTIPFLTLLLLVGCARHEQHATTTAEDEMPVLQAAVLEVGQSAWPVMVRCQGSLFADEVAVVGAKVPGRVGAVHVDLGDFVQQGAELVTLEPEEFQLEVSQSMAQLSQARAALGLEPQQSIDQLDPATAPAVREQLAAWNEAKLRSDRIHQLSQQKAVTESELEQVIAAEKVAEARHAAAINSVNEQIALIHVRGVELALARQRLSDSVAIAPFEGFIQERHTAPGAFVQVGSPLATVVRSNPLRFRGSVPERYAQQLKLGQEVRLRVEFVPGIRNVVITRISPIIDPLSRALSFEAEVQNTDGALRTGLFGESQIVLDPHATQISVPEDAIIEFAGTEKVWKVVDGIAREQVVQSGERRDGFAVIQSGLNVGDVILSNGSEGKVARIEPLQAAAAQVRHDLRPNGPVAAAPVPDSEALDVKVE